jgi:aryl-alcohol dehydrogenase-like predicted oxidoreductase
MSLSHAYGVPPTPDDAARLLLEALDLGVELFDTAALYGFGANETLLGRVLSPHRARFMLASKGGLAGVDGKRMIDGRPETLRRHCEDSLRRLRTDVIDLYYLHRWDRKVPIEDSVGLLADLVREGKIRSIGLSEVSAATLQKACAVHPIAALQNEYSLWTRNPEVAVLQACRELGVALVTFSPLARGYLGGELRDVSRLEQNDIRRAMPRFEPTNYAHNLALLDPYEALASELACTPAQLALAWVLAQDPCIVAIPGTTRIAHLRDNVAAQNVYLETAVLHRLEALIYQGNVAGARYGPATRAEIDAEDVSA